MIGQSEDCLYLNIWAPRTGYHSGKKAVMFWLYGGGYNSGSNRIPTYDGGILSARGDVVVVSVNHRLGVFGFLSTSSDEAKGNMGLYDVLEALRWVKRNIRAFGGDPDNITIFGHSAGALTIGLFCTSPLAAGLFRRAILESAAPTRLVEETNKDARTLAYAAESLNNFPVTTFNYVYGDDLLPTNPRLAVRALQFANVDVLIGNTQDEGSFRLPASMPEVFGPFGEKNTCINRTSGIDLILRLFGSFPGREAIAQWYLGNAEECDYDYVRRQVYNSNGDYALFCPDVYFAERYARKGNPVYFYYFNHKPSVTPWAAWMGAAHGDEVPFVFGRPLERGSNYSVPEKRLSEEMIKMWTNFAKYGYVMKLLLLYFK
ncbi:acetylcholinesterase-1-like [Uloborus diversus]|uniref:acetylcholinesterase-1-like n=1 Tax=Uloborus diversus TaxID=327109 RepID=UPI002409C55E|nr:acetylcholinesterase-1-like [Uloborus diversus]